MIRFIFVSSAREILGTCKNELSSVKLQRFASSELIELFGTSSASVSFCEGFDMSSSVLKY